MCCRVNAVVHAVAAEQGVVAEARPGKNCTQLHLGGRGDELMVL